ncbi:aldolase catalytic domain-containing protein [Agrobacterium tumefaciens]|uniref:aldolase catalytic domain-containing protein n=1 Tax=Agrobacterium tumefaciens TaxID=358 RepID=UPI0021CE314E|nr:aldolase catalytic domain-containing protein [Agrobacterium tumefaciens]UXS01902.1 nucleoid-structuring protein H-NS [Agrobacterium tumefaciens]
MNSVKILDVTLRDGGYRNNFNFTKDYACKAISRLADIGVQYCEIGYCNGSFVRKPEHGLTSSVSVDYLRAVSTSSGQNLSLAVMVHPRNVGPSDFEMLHEEGVSMIRVCLKREQLNEGLATIRLAKSLGFLVSANVTHITAQTVSAVIDTSLQAEGAGADLVCFADSNGNMIPTDVERLIGRVFNRVIVPIGFHAHNNLSLALANAIAAMEAGAEYIDTSICGMGKGAGNLHLAMLIAYLDRAGIKHQYDLVKAIELSLLTSQQVPDSDISAPLLDIMMGAYNFSYDVGKRLQETLSNFQLASEFHALQVMHQQDQVARLAPRAVGSTATMPHVRHSM